MAFHMVEAGDVERDKIHTVLKGVSTEGDGQKYQPRLTSHNGNTNHVGQQQGLSAHLTYTGG